MKFFGSIVFKDCEVIINTGARHRDMPDFQGSDKGGSESGDDGAEEEDADDIYADDIYLGEDDMEATLAYLSGEIDYDEMDDPPSGD